VSRIRIRDPVPFGLLDPEWVKSGYGSGMNILDHISEKWKQFFGLKILKFFDADLDPGSFDPESGMEKFGSGIKVSDPQHWL
jgi:hypothetical protein